MSAWNDLPLRGYTGTIAQDTGDDENAVMSQKATTEKLSELGSEVLNIGSGGGGEFEFSGTANRTNHFKCKLAKGAIFSATNLAPSSCSLYLYDEEKNVVEELSQGLAYGATVTYKVKTDAVYYNGGYTAENYHIKIFNIVSSSSATIQESINLINLFRL